MRVQIESCDGTVIARAFMNHDFDEKPVATSCEATLEEAIVKLVNSFDKMQADVVTELKAMGLIRFQTDATPTTDIGKEVS